MSETLQLDPAKTALVLIEYQNEFTSEGGVLHGAVAPVMDKTGMLAKTVALVHARDAEASVDLRHDPWQPTPNRPSEPWPPHLPTDPGLPGWLEERLFDQRIVMLRGPLSQPAATGIAAALLTLDAAGPAPITLHVASAGGELAPRSRSST